MRNDTRGLIDQLYPDKGRPCADSPGEASVVRAAVSGVITGIGHEQIVEEARTRWDVIDCTVIHRYGELKPTDRIVLVVVASGHRGDAFAACEFIMDYLKTRAPFWKKEATPDGVRWVDARASDDDAAARWNAAPGTSPPT